MAHDNRGNAPVCDAIIECFQAYMAGYIDDINAKYGWRLSEPRTYRLAQLLPDPRGNTPMVGVYASAETNLRGCASGSLDYRTTYVFDLLLGSSDIRKGNGPDTLVRAHSEYNRALIRCIYRDIRENGGRLTGAGVKFPSPEPGSLQTYFDPEQLGYSEATHPHIRLARTRIVLQRRETL